MTPKQDLFVKNYLVSFNATDAAIKAGYSQKTAYRIGFENLKKPQIQKAIEANNSALTNKLEITQERILSEIAKLAFLDVKEIFNADGSMKALNDIPDNARAAIAGIEVSEEFAGKGEEREQVGLLKKVKLSDKTRALELLGRYFKMFTDRAEIEQTGAVKVIFEDA